MYRALNVWQLVGGCSCCLLWVGVLVDSRVSSNFLVSGNRLVKVVGIGVLVLHVGLWLLDVGFCWGVLVVAKLGVVEAMPFGGVAVVVVAAAAGVGGGFVRCLSWVVS